jgi:hypothetical protein
MMERNRPRIRPRILEWLAAMRELQSATGEELSALFGRTLLPSAEGATAGRGIQRRTMKKTKFLWIITVTALLTLACAAITRSIPTATSIPTGMPAASESAPVASPSPAPTATPTSTPLPDWVAAFAAPILKAIADQPPRFQDDFSDSNSNWIIGKQGENLGPATPMPTPNPGQRAVGETGYVDGEYFTIAEPNSCLGGTNSRIGDYQDFVAEFDARFVSGADGEWQLQFHNNRNGLYTLSITENSDNTWIQKCVSGTPTECGAIARSEGKQVNNGMEWNHMLLIVRGAKISVYANGTPVLFTEDKYFSEKFKTGTFSLNVCNTGNIPVEIRWDNLKLWDISNLP